MPLSRAHGVLAWIPALVALAVFPASAAGQGIVTQRNLSLAMARTIADAALAACQAKSFHTAVVVLDRAGQTLVVLRDEKASPATVEMASRKAYTALAFGTTTLEFQKRTMEPAFAAQRDVSKILALGGGVPIVSGGETIGGVASSGSGQQQDDACAKAGVAKVAAELK